MSLWSRNIPLLAEEGWLRHQKNAAKPPKRRSRGGQTGATSRRTSIEASPYRARASRHPSARRGMRSTYHFTARELDFSENGAWPSPPSAVSGIPLANPGSVVAAVSSSVPRTIPGLTSVPVIVCY